VKFELAKTLLWQLQIIYIAICVMLSHLLIIVLLCAAAAAPSTDRDAQMESALAAHCGGPCALSNGHPIASIAVNMSLHGAGFHRALRYSLAARCAPPATAAGGDANDGVAPRCELALLQPLPPAIFADPYQLDNAAAAGHGPRVRLFGAVDLESVEAQADGAVLAVYGTLQVGGAAGACAEATLTLEVDLHARYPRPRLPAILESWQDYVLSPMATATLPPPRLLARCSGTGAEGGAWEVVGSEASGDATWQVPAGNLLHAKAAAAVTSACVLGGAAAVLAAVVRTGPGAAPLGGAVAVTPGTRGNSKQKAEAVELRQRQAAATAVPRRSARLARGDRGLG
jgi:hypothetical protein